MNDPDRLTGWAPSTRPPTDTPPPRPGAVPGPTLGGPDSPPPDAGSAPSAPRSPRRRPPTPALFRNRRIALIAIAVVAVAVGVVVLRGGDGGGSVEDRMAEALTQSGVPADDAKCMAGVVVDELGTDDLGKIDDFSAPEVPDGLSDGFAERFTVAQTKAVSECEVDLSGAPAG